MKRERREGTREDLRQKRTRKFLVNALLELLEERPFSEISVVDICERAMVHRTTFYAHFDDKQALLRYTVLQLQADLEDQSLAGRCFSSPREYFIAVARDVLAFMRQHKKLYEAGVSGCDGMELHILEDAVAQQLKQRLSQPGFLPRLDGFHPEIAAHFYAGAVLALIRWWLEHGMPVSDEVLLGHLEQFIPDVPGGKG